MVMVEPTLEEGYPLKERYPQLSIKSQDLFKRYLIFIQMRLPTEIKFITYY
jgi:hypothetical protein